MRYVIIRDDDTNALTPVDCLETLFRPFLDQGLPINLAVIPRVKTTVKLKDGNFESYLMMRQATTPEFLPLSSHKELVQYLRANSGYCLAQHGYHHEFEEFMIRDRQEIAHRLDAGIQCFIEAGLARPEAFVAPQDKFSPQLAMEAAQRFRILSTSWFDHTKIPLSWWPQYLMKKMRHQHHWRVGKLLLLTRPVSEISYLQPYEMILARVKQSIAERKLTLLLTHWWEFFRDRQRDERLIEILHQVADYLAHEKEIKVITFSDLLLNSNIVE